jgi:protein SCO1
MMNRHIIHLGLVFLLAGCSASDAPSPPPLAGASMGGPFTLISESGKTYSDKALAGQYRLVYFGYSFCPDVCPVDVARLMKGFTQLESRNPRLAAQIQPLFITVDPKRDTPEALTQFTNAFHPRLIGLTGSPAQIAQVAATYRIVFEQDKDDGTGRYKVNHNRMTVLYGKKGEPLALIPEDGTPDEIAAELERWAR